MPVSKSAAKALRGSKRKTATNKPIRSRFKKTVKSMREKPSASNLSQAFSALDRAAKKNVIKKQKANRLKQRLSKLLVKK
jgi:ribosomal protein S20